MSRPLTVEERAAEVCADRGYATEAEITKALREAEEAGRQEEREAAIKIAEALKHAGPFDTGEMLDRLAAYSNATCDRIVRALRSRSTKGGEPCSCHLGSVCGKACEKGRHHDGCKGGE